MKPTSIAPIPRIGPRLVLGLLVTLALAAPAQAQDEDAAVEAFLATVSETRDAALERIEEVQAAIGAACVGLAEEACLTNHVAAQLPVVGMELAAYADALEELDVPDAFSDDVEVHVAALRDEVERIAAGVAAASAADTIALDAAFTEQLEAATVLAQQLDPAWARATFLTSASSMTPAPAFGGGSDILAFAGDLTEEERTYLADVRSADRAAASNFACFSEAIARTYGSTAELLAALADCGAGTALPKVEAAARELQPPERFTDEHAWWLEVLTERSRLDRLIGEAAAEGDVVKFLTNNVRLILAFVPVPDLDPAFLRGYPGPGAVLDPSEPLASTTYGRALFRILADYDAANPLFRAYEALEVPFVPREEALPALSELAPELVALDTDLRAAVAALEPPPEFASDHAVMAGFFETYSQGLADLIDAAESGDVDATFAVHDAMDALWCEASAELSEAILPVAGVLFRPDDPSCP